MLELSSGPTCGSGDAMAGLPGRLLLPLLPPLVVGDDSSGKDASGEVGLADRRRRRCFDFLLPLSTAAWCCAASAARTAESGPNSKGGAWWPSRMAAHHSAGRCIQNRARKTHSLTCIDDV